MNEGNLVQIKKEKEGIRMLKFLNDNYNAIDIILTILQLLFDVIVVIAANEYFHLIKRGKERFGFLKDTTISMSNPAYYANHGGKVLIQNSTSNILSIDMDLKDMANVNGDTFSGFCYKYLPQNYWCRFAKNGYSIKLNVDKRKFASLKSLKIEFKDQKHGSVRMALFPLDDDNITCVKCLKEIESNLLFWNNIDEVCIVFLPYENYGEEGNVVLSDLSLIKSRE